MIEFLESVSLFPLVLTLAAYQVGIVCRNRWKSPLANPLLIAVILVLSVLLALGFPSATYQKGMESISWLLTPATVCLALPLYEQVKVLKGKLRAILLGVVTGTVCALALIVGLCWAFGLDRVISVSMLPKSITTAMGIVLSEQNGGIPALSAIAIFITGVSASLMGTSLCKWLKISDPIAQGAAFGTAAHVIGTAKASELGKLQGAVGSLSLTVAGVLTAVVFPLVCQFLPG